MTSCPGLKVRDPYDSTAPNLFFDQALVGTVLAERTAIRGTVSDINLDYWRLEMARLGSEDFIELGSGQDPMERDVLAHVDPTYLANGFYVLRLSARDVSGRKSATELTMEVNTPAKSAAYHRTETDFSVNLDGVPVELLRTYNSLERQSAAAFGYGWRLANRQTEIQTNIAPTGQEQYGLYNGLPPVKSA